MILYDSRWFGMYGIGRFAKEVYKRLEQEVRLMPGGVSPVSPMDCFHSSMVIRSIKPDVYFSPGFNPPLRVPVPFVFTIHDLNHIKLRENSSLLKRAYYRYIMKPACRRAYRVLTVSEFSRSEILDWSGVDEGRVINVGNGVDDCFSPDGPRHTGDPYLLYLGNNKPHKNMYRMLTAYALSGVNNDFKLLMSCRDDPGLRHILQRLHLEPDVAFLNFIDEKDLPTYIRGARGLLLPSLYEGFGLPILEAMRCGTIPLTSNLGAMKELADGCGYLVDPLSIESIAEGIKRLCYDDEKNKNLRINCIEQSKRYTWEETSSRINNVLAQLS